VNMRGLALLVLAFVVPAAACGGDDDGNAATATPGSTPAATAATGLAVVDVWARAPSDTQGAAYFTVRAGKEADRLVGVSTSAARMAEMHTTVTEGSTSRMEKVSGFDVPAGGTLELKPGANHIMLMGLASPLAVGDVIRLELTFERAGKVSIEARVEPTGPMQQAK